MRPRLVWFVAGTAAGMYSAAKARRAAYRLSAAGLADQAAAAGKAWQAFSAEMHDGMRARENEIAHTLALKAHDASAMMELRPADQALPTKEQN
jgi:hypothetical protein